MSLPFPFKRIKRGARPETEGSLALADGQQRKPLATAPSVSIVQPRTAQPVAELEPAAVDAPPLPAAMAVEPAPSAQPTVDRSEMGRSPWFKHIRPKLNVRGRTPDERIDELQEHKGHLEDYEPQKQKGAKRWVGPILQGILSGMRGGSLYGAAGGALFGGVRALVDPKAADRDWEARESAKTDQRVAGEQAQSDDRWKRMLTQSQIGENVAQAHSATARAANDERRIGVMEGRLDEMSRSNKERERDRDDDRGVKVTEGEKNREVKRELGFATIEQRKTAAENNLKYRQRKDAATLAQRQREHSDRMAQGHARLAVAQGNLAERVNSRLSAEAARKIGQGQRATSIKISVARAKAWAEKEGAQWDDFLDALDENGVIVTDK